MDTSFKTPFTSSIASVLNQRSNDFQQIMSKGIPCHVVKIDKDIVTVAFDSQNNIWATPQMKMPVAFSTYARDPTQIGDKGVAVPADMNLGGNSGLGGTADYSMRGNLTPLVFHPISNTNNESRDYDQYTLTGGPKGVKIIQSKQQSNNPSGATTPFRRRSVTQAMIYRHYPQRLRMRKLQPQPIANAGDNKAFMQIDDQGVILHQSPQSKHQIGIDEQNKKIYTNIPADGQHNIYHGGPGKQPELYGPVLVMGPGGPTPAVNVMAKYVQQDEN